MTIILAVAGLINKENPVDFTNPEVVIIAEGIKVRACYLFYTLFL